MDCDAAVWRRVGRWSRLLWNGDLVGKVWSPARSGTGWWETTDGHYECCEMRSRADGEAALLALFVGGGATVVGDDCDTAAWTAGSGACDSHPGPVDVCE